MTVKPQIIHGLRWTAGARFTAQFIMWAITLYVVRILRPEDYGLMSIATTLIAFTTIFNEFGVIQALIQKGEIGNYLIRQIQGFLILINLSIFIFLLLIAPYFSTFFETGRLTQIIRVLSLTVLFGTCAAIPVALLQREMKFKLIAIVEFISMITASVATLIFAVLGWGVWALILGALAMQFVRTAGILLFSRIWITPIFHFNGLGQIFEFGAKLTGQKFLWHINSQADVLLVGKILGQQVLGHYTVAFHIATLPMSKVMGIVNQVAFPAYSRLQNDRALAADYFLKSVQLSLFIFVPILWGLSSVSSEFVDIFLGAKWADTKIILLIVTLIIPFQTPLMLLNSLTDGLGRPGLGLRNLFTVTLILPPAVLVGTNWGLIGVGISYLVARALTFLINFRRSLPVIGISRTELVAAFAPSVFSGIVMYAVVAGVRNYVVPGENPITRLAILVGTGIVVYTLMTFLVNRDTARRLVALTLKAEA